uniref:Pectinesterase inhibitor domain-containing protein n=1 Tax=Kalanchoe fedtschenkoi TaxID=63787 RepID=A0A7N0U7Y6_KALFE
MEPPQRCLLALSPVLIFLLSPISASASVPSAPSNGVDFIRTSCSGTLYLNLCYATLSPFAGSINNSQAQLAEAAISVSLKKSKTAAAYVTRQKDAVDSKAAVPVEDCVSTLTDAVDQTRDSLKLMKEIAGMPNESAKFKASNVQTWMSAALTNQGTCIDGLEEAAAADGPVKAEVIRRAGVAKKVTSNALALINKYVNA